MFSGVSGTSRPAPLPRGLAKRFYGSAILLNTLNRCFPQGGNTASIPSGLEREAGSDGLFRCFVNKLAQICDSKHGGDTVTAIAILQPGSIEYRLSSNCRNENQFRLVKEHLTDILDSWGNVSEEALTDTFLMAELHSDILLKVLVFNRRRLKVYIAGFLGNLDFCLASCDSEERPGARSAARHFRDLKTIAEQAEERWPSVDFAGKCHVLLDAIKERYTDFERFLRAMARGDDRGPSNVTPWTELRHAIGRLHSYSIAVQVFVEARKEWPEFFDSGFEITHVRSASSGGNPVQFKELRCTGNNILRDIGASQNVLSAYQDCTMQYQSLGVHLDANILEQIKDENYTTVVHAEVNVANSISLEDQEPYAEEPVRFFEESTFGRYIGSSKPTCLLCSLYLDEHPMRFKCRQSHDNLYIRWRAPDISQDHTELLETRRLMVEGVVAGLKRILSDTILSRTGTRRKHDSRQTPTDPFRSLQSKSVQTTTDYIEAGSIFNQGIPEDELLQSTDTSDEVITESEMSTEHVQVATHNNRLGDAIGDEYGRGDEDVDDDSDDGGASL